MQTIIDKILDLWAGLPIPVQKAATDFWTYFVAGVVTITFALPDDGNWRNWIITLAVAVFGVALNAARRALAAQLAV